MKFVKSRLFRLIVTTISFSLVVSLSRSIVSVWNKRDIVYEREQALVKVEEENARLQETLKDVQSQEYVERIARDKLGFIKEGESVIILPKSQNTTPNDLANLEEDIPNWQKWWKLFF